MARTWQLRKENWQLPERGALMGILNVTPDSFYDGGRHSTLKSAMAHTQRLIDEGADLIDLGGESTRPGGTPISKEEEQRRVLPILRAMRAKYPDLRISIDTRNPETARLALEAGVDIINDITGLTNPAMLKLCAKHPCGIVLMHIKGTPFNMPDAPVHGNVISEVRNFFTQQVAAAQASGIDLARIVLDPGIGFGKPTSSNLDLIYDLESVRVHDLPLLMGLSRKRFLQEYEPPIPDTVGLYKILPPKKEPIIKDYLTPTIAMSMIAAQNGADIHRIHDVARHREALDIRYRFRDYGKEEEKAPTRKKSTSTTRKKNSSSTTTRKKSSPTKTDTPPTPPPAPQD